MTDATTTVIEAGGKQHFVAEGNRITVNRLAAKEGEMIDTPSLIDETPVTLLVKTHSLGPKINGLKFKNKVRYLKRYGHRQPQTILEVVSIGKKIAPKAEKKVAAPAKKTTAKKGKAK